MWMFTMYKCAILENIIQWYLDMEGLHISAQILSGAPVWICIKIPKTVHIPMRVMLWFNVMKIISDAVCLAMPADLGLQTQDIPLVSQPTWFHTKSVLNSVYVGIKNKHYLQALKFPVKSYTPVWMKSTRARLTRIHQLGFPSYLCPDNNCSQTTEDERCELHCEAILTHQRHVGMQALLWYLGSVCPYRRITSWIRHQLTILNSHVWWRAFQWQFIVSYMRSWVAESLGNNFCWREFHLF